MKNKLLVQDNALSIASYKMTSLEKNIMHAVIDQIEDTDLPTRFYPISINGILDDNEHPVRLDAVKNAITWLLTHDFKIKDKDGYLQTTFISSAYYDNKGFVEIGISMRLRPYLSAFKKRLQLLD